MDIAAAKMIGAGIAMIASLGTGIGLGLVFAAWISAIARNPSAEKKFATIGWVGVGMTEAIALFAMFMVSIIFFI